MTTNIQKAKRKVPDIPGTKPSIQNAQLLVSTGIPSLDHVVGGGLPVGSVILVEEDTYGSYARIMLKYFMAEGVMSSHVLLVASQDIKPTQLVSEMPAAVTDAAVTSRAQGTDEQMKIAWRYQNMKIADTSPSGGKAFGHFYDLTKMMDREVIEQSNISHWDGENPKWNAESFHNNAYVDLLKTIQETLKKEQVLVSDSPEKRNVLRIALHRLGSRLWLCDREEDTHSDLLRFLFCFKALLRSAYAVAMITVPTDQFDNADALVERMEHLADTAIRLESFAGSAKEANPAFSDYHGLLHVRKLAALNSLAPHNPESMDLAFKLRRKKFLIEVLHLPPELSDTVQREQDDIVPSTGGCSTGLKRNPLDF